MIIETTNLNGLLIIIPKVFKDERGYFFESFSKQRYSDAAINEDFIQDNISKSNYGSIRGLHYQVGSNAQGKLCQVLSGKVLDVAVDIRFGSPTFGKYFSIEISDENHIQIWIPPGFAHGFSVLSKKAVFYYKCTRYYSKADERSIIYNDKDLNIDWMVKYPIISEKDLASKTLKEIEHDFVYENK